MSNAEEFVRYSVSDGKGWFEVGAVQMNISERLFASSVGGKTAEADGAGRWVIVILK